jgi:hypothetical protein
MTTTVIPEVINVPRINTAEFVDLTIYNEYGNIANANTYTFSSAYKHETINGVVYLPMAGLLAIGTQPHDLRVTSADTTISLSGINANNISLVLSNKIRGSELKISRGFYDDTYVLGNVYPRFKGIVTGYVIKEDRVDQDDNYTVTLTASSYKTVLENRTAGRFTNSQSWRFFSPNDPSMDNVYSISGRAFDFGKDPQAYNGPAGMIAQPPKRERGFGGGGGK